MALLPLEGGAVINLCASWFYTGVYPYEFYKDIRPYISIDSGASNIGEFHFTPEKYTYTMGLLEEFSLEFALSDDSYYCDGEMILQDYMSNDLLKFVFIDNKYDIYLDSTKLTETQLDNDRYLYIIYKDNILYGYCAKSTDFKVANMIKIFSVEAKISPYQIEFNHKKDKPWSLWLLRISHKPDDLYYAK